MKRSFTAALAVLSLILFSCASLPKSTNAPAQENSSGDSSNKTAAEQSQPSAVNGQNDNNTQSEQTSEQPALNSTPSTTEQPSPAQTDTSSEQASEPALEKIDSDEAVIVSSDETPESEDTVIDTSNLQSIPEEPVVRDAPAEETKTSAAAQTQNAPAQASAQQTPAEQASSAAQPSSAQTPAQSAQTAPASPAQTAAAKSPAKTATALQSKTTAAAQQSALQNKSSSSQTAKTKQTETEQAPSTAEPISAAPVVIKPSRSVTVKKNQYLDVVYPGTGWVYLGETEKTPLFGYFGRKLDTTNTTFALRSRTSGKTVLHFYKNDALTGQYIDDYLDATVTDEVAPAGTRTTAPAYAEVVPPKPSRRGVTEISGEGQSESSMAQTAASSPAPAEKNNAAAKSVSAPQQVSHASSSNQSSSDKKENVKTVIQTSESAPTVSSPALSLPATNASSQTQSASPASSGYAASSSQSAGASSSSLNSATGTSSSSSDNSQPVQLSGTLLDQAQQLYDAEKYDQALPLIQQYLNSETTRIDEALYLQGLILEADSTVKNVRNAIDSYDTIVKNYPASSLWQKARNRSIYLKRFYIDIR